MFGQITHFREDMREGAQGSKRVEYSQQYIEIPFGVLARSFEGLDPPTIHGANRVKHEKIRVYQ
jgi:hypothetical protein